MAAEIYEFAASIPAATAQSAPVTVPLTIPVRIVRRIEVRVPPGPAGKVGFSIGAAEQPIIPANRGAWIITADESFGWDVSNEVESGAWELYGYNTGNFTHTIYVRFLVDLPSVVTPAPATTPIPVQLITPMTATDLAAVTPDAPDLSTLPPDLQAAINAAANVAAPS